MGLVEKSYTGIILIVVFIGIGLGQNEAVRTHAEMIILPLLIMMLYSTFLQIPINELKQSFRNRKFAWTTVIINFIWTPLLAGLLALLFLADHPALYLGFILLMVTPCTDWYLIFTGMAKGNVALSSAILPLNLVLQFLLLPVYLMLFGGATGVIELSFLWESVILVLVIPLALVFLTKLILRTRKEVEATFLSRLSAVPILFLSLAIMAMFASKGHLLLLHLELIGKLLIPILLFFAVNFVVSQKMGQMLGFAYEERVSVSLTTLARNSPIALAIAITAFPNEPLIALTLVIGPLLELPLLAIVSQLLKRRRS